MGITVCEHHKEAVNPWIHGGQRPGADITEFLKPPRKSWSEILWEIKTFKNSSVYGENKKWTSSYKTDKFMGV